MKNYIAARNPFLLCVATSYAMSIRASSVYVGFNAGGIFPDTSPEFLDRFNFMMAEAVPRPIPILAPMGGMSSPEIMQEGLSIGVPYAQTWSCFTDPKGKFASCGKCPKCLDREVWFKEAGISIGDPAKYTQAEWDNYTEFARN